MRLLGIGLRGAMKFCGLIDLPPTVQQTTYDMIIDNIHSAASSIVQLVLKQAVKEEQQEITKQNSSDDIKKTDRFRRWYVAKTWFYLIIWSCSSHWSVDRKSH